MKKKYAPKPQRPRIPLEKVKELYPDLTEVEVKIARNNMEQHALIIRDIWLRLQWDKKLKKKFDKLLKERQVT